MNPRLRPLILLVILAACGGFSTPARAASHPKLDEALDVMAKADAIKGSTDDDRSQMKTLLQQSYDLIQSEAPGPEFQGHRGAAEALLEIGLENLAKMNQLVSNAREPLHSAMEETHWAIDDADNYQPPSILLAPGSAANTINPADPNPLKVAYLPDSSAAPSPKGKQYGKEPLADSDDPNAVAGGQSVYFDMRTGKTVHYKIDAIKPLTKLVYSGKVFRTLTIEIKDPHGISITGAGPIAGGNVEKIVEVPLPGLTHFEIVITSRSAGWLVIKNLGFESNGVAVAPPSSASPVAGAPTPPTPTPDAPRPAPTMSAVGKLTPDQARAVVLITGDNAEGTGFLIKMADGPCVVTNLHVIANNPNLKITTNTGALITVTSMKGAADRDLALLAIKDSGYSYLEMAPDVSAVVQPGDEVVTPGNSEGGEVMLNTAGKVLGIGPERVEFDNPIYHGNSGGPVFHTKSGKVLGVVTEAMKVDVSDALDKVSFASRNSAIGSSMRYFGLRLDTVTSWIPIDSRRFQNEAAFLDQFHARSQALDTYLNAPDDEKPEDILWRNDSKIVKANEACFDDSSGADAAQRMEATRVLYAGLTDIANTDIEPVQNANNFYSFDRERAREEAAYRKAIKTELDGIGDDVSRLDGLARKNN